MSRLKTLPALAIVLMVAGAVSTIVELSARRGFVYFTPVLGPLSVRGAELAVRPSTAGHALVMHGDRVLASLSDAVVPNGSSQSNYRLRFSPLLFLVRLPGERVPVALLITQRPARAEQRRVVLFSDAATEASDAEVLALVNRTLAHRAQPWSAVPGPALLLLGAWFALRRAGRSGARDAARLVTALAGAGVLVAWPLVLAHPAKLLLPAGLSFAICLLVAVGLGPRLQAAIGARPGAGRAACGAGFGFVALVIFTTAYVNLHGFVAPVFVPPDPTLSPGQWLHAEFVRPAVSILLTGALPSVALGALYGLGVPRG